MRVAVSEGAIAYYAKRYREVTGETPKRFVCPITLLDDPEAELCDGHILCDKLESASKLTIVQRADVDNRFGSIVERDFVQFANFRNAPNHEILRAGKDLAITNPLGERMPAFFAGDEASGRFQRIEMYDENGKTVATPFLRSHTLEPGQYSQLEVEWMFYIHKYCFTAAMLKSAYLNMFRLIGYEWPLDCSGDKVRRTLAASLDAPNRKAALDSFSDFEGCCWVTGNDTSEHTPDSLSENWLLFHFTEGDAQDGLLIGVSSLFQINNVLIAVTLPSYNKSGHYFVSWKYYQDFISKHQLRHNIHFARVLDDVLYINPQPMSFQIIDGIPPKNASSRTLSPAG